VARRRKEEKEERGEGSAAVGGRQRAAPVEEGPSRMNGDEEKLGALGLNSGSRRRGDRDTEGFK